MDKLYRGVRAPIAIIALTIVFVVGAIIHSGLGVIGLIIWAGYVLGYLVYWIFRIVNRFKRGSKLIAQDSGVPSPHVPLIAPLWSSPITAAQIRIPTRLSRKVDD